MIEQGTQDDLSLAAFSNAPDKAPYSIVCMISDKEYILFCDESEVFGRYFSNFYGGVLVGSSHYQRITALIEAAKQDLHLHGEIKWSKVSASYLGKYQKIIDLFFQEVIAGHLRVRIMFRQNTHQPIGLTQDQIEGAYFRLYYQFIKHAFGLANAPVQAMPINLRLYFDEFPETREAVTQFKGFIYGLKNNPQIKRAGFTIAPENIAEVRSHDHVLAQCLDIVLGAISFRLNNRHLDKLPGQTRRGKRTVAKETLYKSILHNIRKIKPGFNPGISTGIGSCEERWTSRYLHWRFVPRQMEYRKERAKP